MLVVVVPLMRERHCEVAQHDCNSLSATIHEHPSSVEVCSREFSKRYLSALEQDDSAEIHTLPFVLGSTLRVSHRPHPGEISPVDLSSLPIHRGAVGDSSCEYKEILEGSRGATLAVFTANNAYGSPLVLDKSTSRSPQSKTKNLLSEEHSRERTFLK